MAAYHLDTSLASDVWRGLDQFTQGYIECAMWTLTGDDGESLDHLGLHDIAARTIADVIADCQAFQVNAAAQLAEAGSPIQNGHDFWLTRNRHGAGFWDRGYPAAIGQTLTDLAHGWGACDWYLGDDGLIYQA